MTKPKKKKRAPRNRTISLDGPERELLASRLREAGDLSANDEAADRIIAGDSFEVLKKLKPESYDLLLADPPYNLTKQFGESSFNEMDDDEYRTWTESWLELAMPLLKDTATVYICGDWRSGSAIESSASKFLKLRNRITWEREKGRGAKANWKNASEDIWFFTVSDNYTFDPEAVRLKRNVVAPYRESGKPKDWVEENGSRFRLTAPSNLWSDISVPFWSMPENTDHPTQKPEKLAAKLILASSRVNDRILDPFCGSGTFPVTAFKLNRRFTGIDIDREHCLTALKRLAIAESDDRIQGYSEGIFWERNSGPKRS